MSDARKWIKSNDDRGFIFWYAMPVLTGETIPGKHPRLARWLRSLAERLETLADRYDDQHIPPWRTDPLRYEDVPSTITWGSKYMAYDEPVSPDTSWTVMPDDKT